MKKTIIEIKADSACDELPKFEPMPRYRKIMIHMPIFDELALKMYIEQDIFNEENCRYIMEDSYGNVLIEEHNKFSCREMIFFTAGAFTQYALIHRIKKNKKNKGEIKNDRGGGLSEDR